MELGLRWRIEVDCSNSIFKDPSIPHPSTFKLVTWVHEMSKDWNLCDLLTENSTQRNEEAINNVFWV